MIALTVVLLILLLLAILRVGVIAEYSDAGAELSATAGPVHVKLYPRKAKKAKKKTKRATKKADKEEASKKGGTLEEYKRIVSISLEAAGRFKRRLKIHRLIIHYTAASEDPATAALMFGGASAGLGMLTPVLENNFNIVYRDFRTAVSFQLTTPIIYCKASLSLRLWQIIYIGAGFAYKYFRTR